MTLLVGILQREVLKWKISNQRRFTVIGLTFRWTGSESLHLGLKRSALISFGTLIRQLLLYG